MIELGSLVSFIDGLVFSFLAGSRYQGFGLGYRASGLRKELSLPGYQIPECPRPDPQYLYSIPGLNGNQIVTPLDPGERWKQRRERTTIAKQRNSDYVAVNSRQLMGGTT